MAGFPNDNLANAQTLDPAGGSLSLAYPGSYDWPTAEAGEPVWGAGETLWWVYTADADGQFSFDTTGSDLDTKLQVFSGGPDMASLTLVGQDDDSGGNLTSQLTFTVVAGTTYYAQVDQFNSGRVGTLVVNWGPPPANDNFADRQTLSGGTGSVDVDLTAATFEAGEVAYTGGSVWYAWVAPAAGLALFRTENANVQIHAYAAADQTGYPSVATGTSGQITDGSYAPASWGVYFDAVAGETYYLQVSGPNGAKGLMTWQPLADVPLHTEGGASYYDAVSWDVPAGSRSTTSGALTIDSVNTDPAWAAGSGIADPIRFACALRSGQSDPPADATITDIGCYTSAHNDAIQATNRLVFGLVTAGGAETDSSALTTNAGTSIYSYQRGVGTPITNPAEVAATAWRLLIGTPVGDSTLCYPSQPIGAYFSWQHQVGAEVPPWTPPSKVTAPLRQRARDTYRQRRTDSRQRTVRQRSYL